jgi:2-polyprenyl-3-methyl-5-hydroxy-6-metoxy-1,4-benzoquinol methylase
MNCRICGNQIEDEPIKIKEMLIGLDESFDYYRCTSCNCLQIHTIPSDMTKYYTVDYCAHFEQKLSPFVRRLMNIRDKYVIFNRGFVGNLVYSIFPRPPRIGMIRRTNIGPDSKILDIGCGSGQLLRTLECCGLKTLVGVDPFAAEAYQGRRVKIFKDSLEKLSLDTFDLVILDHSLEHIPDQFETFRLIAKVLSESGQVLIRTPVIPSYAWETYGKNWVQLDAPRHFYIHSRTSIALLAANAKLEITNTIFDSTAFQFWASEQHAKGVPLLSKNSYGVNPTHSMFTSRAIQEYRRKAKELNSAQLGDQAVFYLSHKNG